MQNMERHLFQKILIPNLLVLLIVFAFYCNNPHGPEILNNNEEDDGEEVDYPFNGEADFTGDEATVMTKCWEFTLLSVISLESIGGFWPAGYFVPVQFKVKNLHDTYIILSAELDFTIIYRDGNTHLCNCREFPRDYFPDFFE